MPAELPPEAERLLLDLAGAEGALERARDGLSRRELAIAKELMKYLRRGASSAEYRAAAEKLVNLRRTMYRSELASLAAAIVNAERRRHRLLRQLDAFDLGEGLGDMAPRGFNLRGTYSMAASYRAGDVAMLNGSSFVARRDNPGACPGDGWQLLAMRGKTGRPGVDFRNRGGA
jgi:hypothetical protein